MIICVQVYNNINFTINREAIETVTKFRYLDDKVFEKWHHAEEVKTCRCPHQNCKDQICETEKYSSTVNLRRTFNKQMVIKILQRNVFQFLRCINIAKTKKMIIFRQKYFNINFTKNCKANLRLNKLNICGAILDTPVNIPL